MPPPPYLTIVVIFIDYDFLQPHLPHLQTSQEQLSPLQLGHLQSSHPQSAAVAAAVAATAGAIRVSQHDACGFEQQDAAAVVVAALQPQLPHSQSTQEHVPSQLGQAQSTQPHSALAKLLETRLPAKANAYVSPIAATKSRAITDKRFMEKLLREKMVENSPDELI
ncbi:MAG: hypothetical protein IT427_13545 [Pirellulales bacterium]|nr:hypothetical protein [Pirellulales bacterium]